MSAVIELSGVRKVYKSGDIEFEALRGIDLAIDQGEFVAIVGPSGSGKSTLMNILGCLDIASEGRYTLAGEDVEDLGEAQLSRIRNKEIGFVFQGFNLLTSLKAWQNVELPLVYAGVHRTERRERAIAALKRVGLGDKTENKPGELSGGQQQRVAIARALVGEPTMILADEPTGNLDSVSTEAVLGLFAELNADGRTVVLITHEHDVAARAKRAVRVRDGRIIADETVTPAMSAVRA